MSFFDGGSSPTPTGVGTTLISVGSGGAIGASGATSNIEWALVAGTAIAVIPALLAVINHLVGIYSSWRREKREAEEHELRMAQLRRNQ